MAYFQSLNTGGLGAIPRGSSVSTAAGIGEPDLADPSAPAREARGAHALPTSTAAPLTSERFNGLRIVLAIFANLLTLDRDAALRSRLIWVGLGFAVYALVLEVARLRRAGWAGALTANWIDACWCLALFQLSGGGHEFLVLLLLPIIFVAVRVGYRESLELCAFCTLFVAGILALRPGPAVWSTIFDLPVAFLVAGTLSAFLTRKELLSQKRYSFAADMVERLGRRQGVEATANVTLDGLSERCGGEVALLAIQPNDAHARVFIIENRQPPGELSNEAAAAVVRDLFTSTQNVSLTLAPRERFSWIRERVEHLDAQGNVLRREKQLPEGLREIGALFDMPSLMFVSAGLSGPVRLSLVVGRRETRFKPALAEAVRHSLEHLVPLFDNALLIDRLIGSATEMERARIGRDLHDSAVQPYIGLKFGIESLLAQAPENSALRADIERLYEMAKDELSAMRDVVHGLRHGGASDALLASAVRRQAARFSDLFGIDVQVEIQGKLPVNRNIAGEVFHLVAEGLSNIRRHTQARHAMVTLRARDNELLLDIYNENVDGEVDSKEFHPRSLSERVRDLGGDLTLLRSRQGTTLHVTLPLPRGARHD